VQSHVSHILAELDLRSRVEIAARRADAALPDGERGWVNG